MNSLNDWFQSLPKLMLVGLLLAGGVLFIVLSDPPRTICDSQIKHFTELTGSFLAIDKTAKPVRSDSRFNRLMETCKTSNAAGGCYELFSSLKKMITEIYVVSPECYSDLQNHSNFKSALWNSLDLMVRLAWSTQDVSQAATAGYSTATTSRGWFDSSDLNLYCRMKKSSIDIYGQQMWDSFTAEYFSLLNGADKIPREEAWQKMLFSINCQSFL